MKKVMAVSSGGGHWEEMMLIRQGFRASEVIYVNTFAGLAERSGVGPYYVISDCSRASVLSSIRCALELWKIMGRERPDVVLSTGAAPGLIALAIGKMRGARTVWIDSIANAEELSLSGRMAGKFADLWLTQWRHLCSPNGPKYWGSVL